MTVFEYGYFFENINSGTLYSDNSYLLSKLETTGGGEEYTSIFWGSSGIEYIPAISTADIRSYWNDSEIISKNHIFEAKANYTESVDASYVSCVVNCVIGSQSFTIVNSPSFAETTWTTPITLTDEQLQTAVTNGSTDINWTLTATAHTTEEYQSKTGETLYTHYYPNIYLYVDQQAIKIEWEFKSKGNSFFNAMSF
jgi:hypothetical protein